MANIFKRRSLLRRMNALEKGEIALFRGLIEELEHNTNLSEEEIGTDLQDIYKFAKKAKKKLEELRQEAGISKLLDEIQAVLHRESKEEALRLRKKIQKELDREQGGSTPPLREKIQNELNYTKAVLKWELNEQIHLDRMQVEHVFNFLKEQRWSSKQDRQEKIDKLHYIAKDVERRMESYLKAPLFASQWRNKKRNLKKLLGDCREMFPRDMIIQINKEMKKSERLYKKLKDTTFLNRREGQTQEARQTWMKLGKLLKKELKQDLLVPKDRETYERELQEMGQYSWQIIVEPGIQFFDKKRKELETSNLSKKDKKAKTKKIHTVGLMLKKEIETELEQDLLSTQKRKEFRRYITNLKEALEQYPKPLPTASYEGSFISTYDHQENAIKRIAAGIREFKELYAELEQGRIELDEKRIEKIVSQMGEIKDKVMLVLHSVPTDGGDVEFAKRIKREQNSLNDLFKKANDLLEARKAIAATSGPEPQDEIILGYQHISADIDKHQTLFVNLDKKSTLTTDDHTQIQKIFEIGLRLKAKIEKELNREDLSPEERKSFRKQMNVLKNRLLRTGERYSAQPAKKLAQELFFSSYDRQENALQDAKSDIQEFQKLFYHLAANKIKSSPAARQEIIVQMEKIKEKVEPILKDAPTEGGDFEWATHIKQHKVMLKKYLN